MRVLGTVHSGQVAAAAVEAVWIVSVCSTICTASILSGVMGNKLSIGNKGDSLK
jgi:hypothetical protein